MFDQIFTIALQKYGIAACIGLYIFKTLWDLFSGNLLHYVKAINDNTAALEKVSKDLRVAFYNIKQVREKTGLGEISKPDNELDQ